MWTVRYILERCLPEEWEANEADKSQRIRNCTILEYTRVDPVTGQIFPVLGWRRTRYTDTDLSSPFDGQWVNLGPRRMFTGADLTNMVEKFDM